MAATTVWGVDIGNSAIKAVKMTRVGPACKIEEFEIIEIPNSEEEKDQGPRLQTALTSLTTNRKFGKDPVFLAITGNMCLHREFQLPAGSDDKLLELVQYEAKQQIPFPLEQVEWGFERYEDPAGVGIALIAVKKNEIADLLAITDKAGLNVKGITTAPMALFNFIHYEFKPEATTLILDAGAKGTDFVVMNKRQVYSRTIQIAGREITRALENKFKVPFAKAEELKKNISQSPQKDKILQVIEPTLRQLGAEVQRTIGFYKSKARGQRLSQCYLLGHTFRLPGMAETLQGQVREAPFAIVEGLQRVKIDNSLSAEVWNNEFPTMAVAIGLGIQGLGLSELTLNLIPKTRQDGEQNIKVKGFALASAALVLLTLGVAYLHEQKLLDSYTRKLEELTKAEESVQKYTKEEAKITATLPQREELLKRMARIARDRGKAVQAYNHILALKGPDAKPVFGLDNKIFITNFYVSRSPIPLASSADTLVDSARTAAMAKSQNLKAGGASSVYAFLAKGADPFAMSPELRPDVPMIIVVSGEIEGDDETGRAKLLLIENALRDMKNNVVDVRITDRELGALSYTETGLAYNYQTGRFADQNAKTETRKCTVFHAIVHWKDPNDPDREPEELQAPAAKPGAPKPGAPNAPK